MAGDLTSMGDLVIQVGGDISPLEQALGQIPAVAETAAGEIQAAFEGVSATTGGIEQSLQGLSTGLAETGSAAAGAEGQLALFGEEMSGVGEAIQFANLPAAGEQMGLFTEYVNDATTQLKEVPPELESTASAAQAAEEGLATVGEAMREIANTWLGTYATFEGLKEVLMGSTEAFGEFQRASIALTAIAGNATEAADAMERIPALADQLGTSVVTLEDAQQRLAAIGVPLSQIPTVLTGIADAAAAMDLPFQNVEQRFDAMANSGVLMNRSLATLGINMQDIGNAMGLVDASSKDVAAAFKEVSENEGAAAAAAILAQAAMEKFPDVAQQAATGVTGAWNQISNQLHEALVNIGEQLGGFTGVAKAAAVVIKFLEDVFLEFVGVCKVVADVVIALSGTVNTVFMAMGKASLDALSGNFKQAADDIQTMGARITGYWGNFTESIKKDWADTGAAIDKVWSSQDAKLTAAIPKLGQVAAAHKAAAAAATEYVSGLQQLNDALDKLSLARHTAEVQAHAKAIDDLRNSYIIYTESIRINEQLNEEALVTDEQYKTVLDGMVAAQANYIEGVDALNTAVQEQANGVMDFDKALHVLNIDSDSAVQKQLDLISSAYDFIIAMHAVGAATDEEVARASDAYTAGVAKLAGASKEVTQTAQAVGDAWDKTAKQINNAIERDMSKAFADLITGTGNIAQAFTKLGTDILSIVLDQIIKRALQPLLKNIDAVMGSLMQSFGAGGIAETVTKNTANQVQQIGESTVSSIKSLGGAAVSMLGSVFSMVTGALSAIGSIITSFELAHTNTLLSRIEESTRRMDIATEQQPQSILWSGQKSVEFLGYANASLDTMKGSLLKIADTATQMVSYLNQLVVANTQSMVADGGGGGGGGSSDSMVQPLNTLQDAVGKLESTATALSTDVSGSYGLGVQVQGLSGNVQNLNTSSDNLSSSSTSLAHSASALSATASAVGTVVTNAVVTTGAMAQVAVDAAAAVVIKIGAGAIGVTPTPRVSSLWVKVGAGAGNPNAVQQQPWLYGLAPSGGPSIVNMNVDLTGSVVTGQNAMQNLSNAMADAMVTKLAQMGVRVTRQ